MTNLHCIGFSRLWRVDKAWGQFDNETKEWSGKIRSLILNEIDIAWSSLTIGVERKTVVDFLLPYATETHCVVRYIMSVHKDTSTKYLLTGHKQE